MSPAFNGTRNERLPLAAGAASLEPGGHGLGMDVVEGATVPGLVAGGRRRGAGM